MYPAGFLCMLYTFLQNLIKFLHDCVVQFEHGFELVGHNSFYVVATHQFHGCFDVGSMGVPVPALDLTEALCNVISPHKLLVATATQNQFQLN